MDKFTDIVLSWSPHQIFDDNLYKNQVEMIPESFDSVDRYLGSYVFPLLEETRAELASAMEAVHRAPFAEVTSLRESKPGKVVYTVKLDYWRNEMSDRGSREPYRTLPGDVFLLCDLKPQSDSDVQRAGHVFTFACVEGDGTGVCTTSGFRLKTSEHVGVVHGHGKPLYMVYLTNFNTQRRIWNALKMRKNLKIIEKVLNKNDLGMGDCDFCPLKCIGETEENLALISKLNESQLEAVSTSLSKAGCDHKSSVELIWGPPGTGKTTTLSILLYTLLTMKVRTVVCAPTNVAIRELASRVIALVRSSLKSESKKNISSACSLGDILLYGNRDKLKVGSDVEEIFLDDRVKRLIDCSIGWKTSVASMLNFLDDCVSQYDQILVDNEISKSKDTHPKTSSHSKTLLEFVRDQFSHLAIPLRNHMLTIITHLPRSMIHEQSLQVIEQLIPLVDSIEALFYKSNMTSEKLEKIFLQQEMLDFEPLVDIKSKCLSTLRLMHAHIDKLGLPNIGTSRTSTEEFCYRKASLIFCTTSSAIKLHSIDMKPINVLVIDEAAQVKECESIIALQLPGVRHAILVGDEKQLPAMVKSKACEELGFGRSLFERLSSLGHSRHLLDVQYRMHPSISQFPNSNFYLNQILDAPSVQSPRYERRFLQGRMFGPYSFINVRGGKEESDDISHSKRNMSEVAVIEMLVQKLFEAWNFTNEKLSIGVISPYAAQVARIQHKLEHKYKNRERFTVNVKSVDGFQGGEEDIIIMSTVRSRSSGSIGFLASPQRTNVALTRARQCLWILGNEGALSRSDSIWEALICDAKLRQCFFNADDDLEIRETIVKVNIELGQLEDVFSPESFLFKNSIWKVSFSDNFRKSFQILIPSNVKKLTISLLLKLASGWRPKKINVDWTCPISSYVVKQFKVDRFYIVCSVDIIKDSVYEQVLKVWDILPMTEIYQLLKRLNSMSSTYTSVFIKHCNEKLFEGNLEVPKSWPISDDIIRYKDNSTKASAGTSAGAAESQGYVESSKFSESLLLMKFYSLSSGTVNHLLTDREGGELELPFEVTDEERKIIMFPKSSFILGRSGTGKTTILTMKLLQKFQQYCIASGESTGESRETILHQIFVTVSPKLCRAVKKHVSELQSLSCEYLYGKRNITDMDDREEMTEFDDIPDTFDGIQPEKYPLIITFRKFLMMLDGTLGNSYFQRFCDVRGSSGSSSVALQTFIRKNEVTYDRFQCLYWAHFNAKLTKNLDPSGVFTEIMSHIKGGPQEWDSIRSRRDYVSLSGSKKSTLIAEQREVVYDIFEDYEKMKFGRGEFDIGDFVIDVHLRLKKKNTLGDKIDFVYIDEVQDLTMRQISLFKYICKNVDEGFVFSGDTAQTIAQGIDFRFEDIRSLFYNEFFMKSRKCDFQGRREKGLISDTFCLSQNFRTHTGVLMLAQSVVDIICHFFPQSIDILPPETSHIHGEPPVVLKPGCDDKSILTIFGKSQNAGGKWRGFGADQVILVRDDSSRQEISKDVGHQALILTILECKGLEFQDVLLYNFFESSPLSNHWRVVYDFLKERDLLKANSPKSFPSFSQSKHNLMCSELKQLYVAITRTRQKLWIYENNEELSRPMLDYWSRLGLVQVRQVDHYFAKEMQREASSPEEWKSQGIKLFWEKNYKMAMVCFKKAGEETWEKRVKASQQRANADKLRVSNPEESWELLREAAEVFVSIDRFDSAAECFCDLGEYERAGWIYLEKCGSSELRKAGECFSLAGNHKIAAEVYDKGYFFQECLSSCSSGSHLDLGLQYIENWRQQASSNIQNMTRYKEIDKISQEFLEKCALEYFRAKDNASLMKFVRAFYSMELKRHFLKSLDCLDELLSLEEEMGNFNEAAEIAKCLGYILREVTLLEKSQLFVNASLLILSHVLSNSLWVSGSQGWPLKTFRQKSKLLTDTISFAQKVSGTFHASVCLEAQALSHGQANLSELVKCYRDSKIYKNHTGEILFLRKLLEAHFKVSSAEYDCNFESNNIIWRLSDETLSTGRVSGGTLLYAWNMWKAHCQDILECLPSLERVGFTSSECTRFCFNYFGVRFTQNLSLTFILMNPEAAWLKYVDEGVILRNYRGIATLEARHFVMAARIYWRQELISCGLTVLESIKKLYEYSMSRPLSKYSQSMCLTYIFEISRFLKNSKSLHTKETDVSKLNGFLQLSIKYIENVFPLDTRQSLSENMMSLRETELSKNILEEIISRNISGMKKLSYGQIGRVAMIILGSGPPKHGHDSDRITKRLYVWSSWKSFIEKFKLRNSDPEALSHEFHQALAETYNEANWRGSGDYISPHCFFYLVERLLILSPHSRGFFFVTKSSFVEYLTSLPCDADPSAGLVTDRKSHPTSIGEFVLNASRECLLSRSGTAEWIEISGIDCEYYIPVLTLRLVMIMCVSCMNSGLSFEVILELLDKHDIRSQLPIEFCEAIDRERKNDALSYVAVVSQAFKAVGDPLLVVTESSDCLKFVCRDAIVIDFSLFSRKTEIMEALFPKRTEA